MSLSWTQRKTKLSALLKSRGDEDVDGVALDRILHGQNVIGKTSKTIAIDELRFQDKDLAIVGTLEYGQYGVIDVVNCRLDSRVYVRKSIEKRFALRARDQCFPQHERDILLQSLKTASGWAPHLLCAFQTPTHLCLVMDYAEGGSLWDVLESSPHNGKILEDDLQWWVPQAVSAIHWCHAQGFAHRDIKPQNFVLTRDGHILLIDFGSAAPLLPPGPDGSQLLPKKYCVVPCGTCDYISPEILEAHEQALVELEMEDDEDFSRINMSNDNSEGYGAETDWWSFGAMLYEMAYGVAPFFANEIRYTYQKIMNHERCLRFDDTIPVSNAYKDFICKLLTRAERRIGRRNIMEITDHPIFEAVNWRTLREEKAPEGLHLPQFIYNDAVGTNLPGPQLEESLSQGFAFSAFFQSSPFVPSSSPGISVRKSTLSTPAKSTPAKSAMQEDPSGAFIGFSWGPSIDAFPSSPTTLSPPTANSFIPTTPRPTSSIPLFTPTLTPAPTPAFLKANNTNNNNHLLTTPLPRFNTFSTPNNRTSYAFTPFRTNTIPRSGPGTIGRNVQRRELSDREAMRQLVDCVGMSARKKVLESGRKPKLLNNPASLRRANGNGYGYGTMRKELRFVAEPIPMPDWKSFSTAASSSISTSVDASGGGGGNANGNNSGGGGGGGESSRNGGGIGQKVNTKEEDDDEEVNDVNGQKLTYAQKGSRLAPIVIDTNTNIKESDYGYGSETDITDSEGPPSPSPRPGSALSYSRRSATPTITMTMQMGMGMMSGNGSSTSRSGLMVPTSTPITATTNTFLGVGMNSSVSMTTRRRERSLSSSSLVAPPLTAKSGSGSFSGRGYGQGYGYDQGQGQGQGQSDRDRDRESVDIDREEKRRTSVGSEGKRRASVGSVDERKQQNYSHDRKISKEHPREMGIGASRSGGGGGGVGSGSGRITVPVPVPGKKGGVGLDTVGKHRNGNEFGNGTRRDRDRDTREREKGWSGGESRGGGGSGSGNMDEFERLEKKLEFLFEDIEDLEDQFKKLKTTLHH